MKKLMLATVSSLALGLAGFGVSFAQTPANPDTNAPPPSATMPATPGAQNPASPTDQGSQANQAATPGAPGATTGTNPSDNSSSQANEANPTGTPGASGTQPDMGNQTAAMGSDMGTMGTAPSRTQMRQAQQQLRAEGLYKGRIDGRMGPRTRRAVLAFQQQHNLNATGTLNQQTISALQEGGGGGANGQTGQNSRG
jgi:hypothetical protein